MRRRPDREPSAAPLGYRTGATLTNTAPRERGSSVGALSGAPRTAMLWVLSSAQDPKRMIFMYFSIAFWVRATSLSVSL